MSTNTKHFRVTKVDRGYACNGVVWRDLNTLADHLQEFWPDCTFEVVNDIDEATKAFWREHGGQ